MRNYDSEMLVYIQLAEIADKKKQHIGRDRFLVLAGAAACRAGCLDIAKRCREIIKQNNPLHFVSRYDSFAAALRDTDFSQFLQQLENNCSFERAEYLLVQSETSSILPDETDANFSELAEQILDAAEWETRK